MTAFQVYLQNRRNSPKQLKCMAVTSTEAIDLDSEALALSNKRPLSSVLNIVDVEKVDPKRKVVVEARTAWLAE
eukprot:4099749-Prymnesium_polylepis.1